MKEHGWQGLGRGYEFESENWRLIHEFFEEHSIDPEFSCEFYKTGGLNVALTESEVKLFQETTSSLKKECPDLIKGLPFQLWDEHTCSKALNLNQKTTSSFNSDSDSSLSIKGGIFMPNIAQVNPAKLTEIIASKACELGLKIFTNTTANQVSLRDGRTFVHTTEDHVIEVKKAVIYANGAWAPQLVNSLKDIIIPVRGQVFATNPLPPLFPFGVGFNDDYVIQRKSDGRIILGGMRRKSVSGGEIGVLDDSQICTQVSTALHDFLLQFFNVDKLQNETDSCSIKASAPFQIENHWTGIMDFSLDGLPLIGELSPFMFLNDGQRDNCQIGSVKRFISAGYTGHGMSRIFGAGKLIAQLVHEEVSNILPFSPSRFQSRVCSTLL
eukprot:TRINITY_DN1816_c0_g1_i1.p1 TRINITY_DN1816_c0_g1~~TRINITY_DN1816_c0_g1_i1.p1  ORF type:complete len:383 (-),score=76.03 TRINITY_DN1816_c0_g1_i1:12-1160(-)